MNDYPSRRSRRGPSRPTPTAFTRATASRRSGQVFRDLHASGFRGYLSLESFNRDYWTRSADENLKTAMEKIRTTVRAAMA